MSRLVTRQAAAGNVDGLSTNPFAPLPREIVLCDPQAGSRIKREHELGAYAELRSTNSTSVEGLRAAALKWLTPRDGEVAEGRSLPARAILTARAPGAATLLVSAVNDAIRAGDWHELALILRQVELWHDTLHRADAELPWWELAPRSHADVVVREEVDFTKDDEPGGKDNALDPGSAGQPLIKMEATAGSSSTATGSAGSQKRGAEEAELGDSDDSDNSEDAGSEYQRFMRALGPIAQPHESHYPLQLISKRSLRIRKSEIVEELQRLQQRLQRDIAEIDGNLASAHAVSDEEIDEADAAASEDEDWTDEWESDHDEWHGGLLLNTCQCARCVARRAQLEPDSSDDEADEAEAVRVTKEAEEDSEGDDEAAMCSLIHTALISIHQDASFDTILCNTAKHDPEIVRLAIEKVRELGELDTKLGRKLIGLLERAHSPLPD